QLPNWASISGATISGTPGEGDGDFRFDIHADDNNGGTDDMTVNVTVTAVNDAPVADAQTVTTGQDEAVVITLSASDADGDNLTFTINAGPRFGLLSGAAPNLTYTPAAGFSGSDRFTFTASDGSLSSAAAEVTIYVNVNEVAVSKSVDENGGTVSWDSDGTGTAVASISIPGGALEGSIDIEISLYSSPPEGAELAGLLFYFGPSGLQFDQPVTVTVPYDPDQIPAGLSESDLVVLRYDEGEASWTALLPSTVDTDNHTVSAQTDHFSGFGAGYPEDTNHAPFAIQALPDAAIDEDVSIAFIITNLMNYFGDLDELDNLTFSALALSAGLDTVFISDNNLGVVPSENFFGTVSIRITASDGIASVSADITLTINPVNDAPEVVTIADLNLVEDTEVWIPLRATDIEGDAISFTAQSDTSAVVHQVFGDTTLLLVPWPNWVGTANITLTATDEIGASETTNFNITFTASNDPPSAFNLSLPLDGHEVQYSSELANLSLAFSWESSTDPDGEDVSYIFVLEDAQSTYLLSDTVGTGFEVPYVDIIAIMDDLGVNNLSIWWSIWAVSGSDTVEAVNGPFEIIIYKTLAIEDDKHLPQIFALHQNYPNPFNPVTTLRYEMPARTKVNITIYDIRGRKVVELVDGYMHAGYNKFIWNSSDSMGRPVPTGIYFARMVTPEYTHTIKMSLIK
ncbi:MAG: tandem-95 repeat protein, partial [Candidatus Marinimicrobia bacterium]|nr:tandem-95 repeat protein [Candidatus Neomarinimicrobiota bacterium]